MPGLAWLVAAALTLAAPSMTAGRARQTERLSTSPLSLDAAVHTMTFPTGTRTVAASADGRWVAYVTQDPRRSRGRVRADAPALEESGNLAALAGCDVWLIETAGGSPRRILEGQGSSWGIAWSPDGATLAFYSDREGQLDLWVWRETGPQRISTPGIDVAYGWELPAWAADSRHIAVKARGARAPDAGSTQRSIASIRVYTTDALRDAPAAALGAKRTDLLEVDLADGSMRVAVKGEAATWFAYAPDGVHLAVATQTPSRALPGPVTSRVHIWSRSSGRVTSTSDVSLGFPAIALAWLPTSAALLVVEAPGPDQRLWLLPVRAQATPRALPLPAGVVHESGHFTPLAHIAYGEAFVIARHTTSGDTILAVDLVTSGVRAIPLPRPWQAAALQADERTCQRGTCLYVRVLNTETKTTGLLRLDARTGAPEIVFDEPRSFAPYGLVPQASFHMNLVGDDLVYTAEGSQTPPTLLARRVRPPSSGEPRVLSAPNAALQAHAYGRAVLVPFTAASGRPLRGALLLPPTPAPTQGYPLVVHLYATRGADNLHRFGLVGPGIANMQVLATRGIAVLMPDLDEVRGDPATTLLGSVPAAIDTLVAQGRVDATRVGIIGHSYGAYTTVLLLTRTTRFRAAVARGGYYDTFAQHGRLGLDGSSPWVSILENGIGLGRDPWAAREAFLGQGPLFALDRVTTPLLLVHGGADASASADQSAAVFVGLRRLGRDVAYVRYEEEEHVEHRWRVDHQIDYLRRMTAWFERHLAAPR